ncbi:MAG: AAA family ATPase [Nitrospirae bacterium]|nr:AAA family ATPase [Nitrospirota bacterium]
MEIKKLPPESLRWICNPREFEFNTTEEVQPLEGTIGQERALRAIDFGLGLESQGFNIYILGESGTGKTTTINKILEMRAMKEKIPDDWCYVYNFDDPDRPKTMSLTPGMGIILQKDMDELINILKVEIPKIFESKEYEKHRNQILEEYQEKSKELLSKIEVEATKKGFTLRKTATGIILAPIKNGGETLSQDEFGALEEDKRRRLEELSKGLQEKLNDALRLAREGEKELKEKISKLERDAALTAIGQLITELESKYRLYPEILKYLEYVKEDILLNLEDFKASEEAIPSLPFLKMPKSEPSFNRYKINVLVNNGGAQGAPVVIETNPTYLNLFGRIEHKIQYGIAITDFTMIKAGSVHRANGGYLIVNALDLLRNIFVWDALKRMIKNREIKIEDIWEQYRLISTVTLKPDPIPLNIKVVLLGSPYLYYLLYNLDEDYKKLFKVKADFDNRMMKTKENLLKYASFISARCREENLRHFDRTGVAKVVEYGVRLAEDQKRLSARFFNIADIVREANYWASQDGNSYITSRHVEKALEEKIYRSNKIEERIQELIDEGTIMVDVDGAVVGQVNGIAVIDLGDYGFGKPSRITAKTYTGKAGVVNIERETKMSGRIHDKAHMILTSYLGGKFSQELPLTLSASICFEQLYEEVEGDSATCTELYALLSSLSGLPIKQGIAVTGSMNQRGEVQPVGGINEKIEGFFEVCKLERLIGEQGVIIPERNVKNLMLKEAVVEAVRDGKFHIYPIEDIDEGIEILTGVNAGKKREDGTYPEGTVNYLVDKRLRDIARTLKEFDKGKKEGEGSS